ncbi:fucolectin-like [Porites lutea]|uniref:fucolectin-like n=1 Tax=Porites lutea TaxID=51062 RepID=UPI003CC5B319
MEFWGPFCGCLSCERSLEVWNKERSDVPSNIALSKNASQSSTYTEPGKSYSASNAVDGDRGTQDYKCTHTIRENNAWWRVDLGRVEPVAEVNIVNRNHHANRLNGAEIRVGNETANGGANNHLCANIIHIPAGSSKTYSCSPKAYGRYLYIRLPNMWLTLCEVEVYSYLKTETGFVGVVIGGSVSFGLNSYDTHSTTVDRVN